MIFNLMCGQDMVPLFHNCKQIFKIFENKLVLKVFFYSSKEFVLDRESSDTLTPSACNANEEFLNNRLKVI